MGQSQILYRFQDGLQVSPDFIASPVYGSAANTVTVGNDNRLSIQQIVLVKKNPGAGEFSTISAALASITDASSTKQYQIQVGPGDYTEAPITLKSYVTINGTWRATKVIASDVNQPLFTMVPFSGLENLYLTGTTNSSLVLADSIANSSIRQINFGSGKTFVEVLSTTGPTLFSVFGMYFVDSVTVDTILKVSGTTNAINVFLQSVYGQLPNTIDDVFYIRGPQVTVSASLIQIFGLGVGNGFHLLDGGNIVGFSIYIKGMDKGLLLDPSISISDVNISDFNSISNTTLDIDIQSANSFGYISGAWENSKVNRDPGSDITLIAIDPSSGFYVNNEAVVTRSAKTVTVRKNPGPSDFATIAAAIAYCITQIPSSTNVFSIEVSDGDFLENNPVTVPSYVNIFGVSGSITTVGPLNNNAPLFLLSESSSLNTLGIRGGTGPLASIVTILPSLGGQAVVNECVLGSCTTGVYCTQATFGFALLSACNHTINASYSNAFIEIGDAVGTNNLTIINIFGFIGPTGTLFKATGPNTSLNIANAIYGSLVVGDVATIFYLTDGVTCSVGNTNFQGVPVKGFDVPLIGTGPTLYVTFFAVITAITSVIDIQNTGTTGFINGSIDKNKVFVNPAASVNFFATDPINNDVGMTVLGDIFQGVDTNSLDNITKLLRSGTVVGIISGATITDLPGLDIQIGSGTGFVVRISGAVRTVNWITTTVTLPANSSRFIFVDENGAFSTSSSYSANTSIIYVCRVVTNATGKQFIEDIRYTMNQYGNQVEDYLKSALGPVFVSGSTVSASATPRQVNVGQGNYYLGTTNFLPSGGNNQIFDQYYRASLTTWTFINGVLVVPNNVWDDGSGTLQPVTAAYYTKHLMLLVGDGSEEKYFLVISQDEYLTLLDAENASLPTVPPYFNGAVVKIASLIMQEGVNAINSIRDERPRIGFAPSAVTGSAIHGNLLGLAADDHTQYLLVSGSRAMSGSLNMGTNTIINAGTINTVSIQAHGSRHAPLGSDPIATAAPTTALSATTTNFLGIQDSLSRSDHGHAIISDAPITIVPLGANGLGSAATLARSDHAHQVDTAAPSVAITPNASAALGAALSFSRSDHVHAIATAAPAVDLSATTANAEGAGNNFARASHLHAILTGVPVAQIPAQVNATGTAASLARSDHVHNIAVGTPVTLIPNAANAAGAAATFVRSDHVHNVPVGTPSVTLAPNTANDPGVAATFVRSDHAHAFALGTPVALTPDLVNAPGTANSFVRSDHIHNVASAIALALSAGQVSAIGTASSFSRSDHVHGVPVAVPVTVGTANAIGASTSFSRADHVHSHGNQAGGALHANATPSVSGFQSAVDKTKADRFDYAWMQYVNGSGFTFNNAAFASTAQLNVDQDSRLGTYFSKPTATNFVVNFTGIVRIFFNLTAFIASNNRSWNIAVQNNGVTINGSNAWGIAQNTAQRKQSSSAAVIVPVTSGDIITFVVSSPEANIVSVAAGDFIASITLMYIN